MSDLCYSDVTCWFSVFLMAPLLAGFISSGCATTSAPVVFHEPIPPEPAVEIPDLPSLTDESCSDVAIDSGHRAIGVSDHDGMATCTGVVTSVRRYVAGPRADALRIHYADLYAECRHYRGADRAHCQDVADALANDNAVLRRDIEIMRIIIVGEAVVIVGTVVAVVLGGLAP